MEVWQTLRLGAPQRSCVPAFEPDHDAPIVDGHGETVGREREVTDLKPARDSYRTTLGYGRRLRQASYRARLSVSPGKWPNLLVSP
jgi:hypothetical protein